MDIRVSAAGKDRETRSHVEEIDNLVTPGDIITSDSGFMRYGPDMSSSYDNYCMYNVIKW